MGPQRGVVTDRNRHSLTIKLENGETVTVPRKEDFDLYEQVFVGYNTIEKEIGQVIKDIPGEETLQIDLEEPIEPEGRFRNE